MISTIQHPQEEFLVERNEERYLILRHQMPNMPAHQGQKSQIPWKATTQGNPTNEMRKHFHGFCDRFA